MGLPAIDSYSMPDRSALPQSHVSWRIDSARAALLVHDMQNHFVGAFPAGRSPAVELVDNIAALREPAGTLDMPVVFSAEPAGQPPGQRGLVADMWGPGIGDEPDAAAIVAPLTPRPGEHLLANVRHNAFLRSHLGRLLRSEGRDQLIICGVYAHLGVLLTAADAFMTASGRRTDTTRDGEHDRTGRGGRSRWLCRRGDPPPAAVASGGGDLRSGEASAAIWTRDLTAAYVHENSTYSTYSS